MTEKEILISDLNDISEILNNNGYGGWCAIIQKAVALLKEQEEEIENLKQTAQSMMEGVCLLKSQPQIVRCKDCKHGKPYCTGDGDYLYGCDLGNRSMGVGNWFCADGERKE